jgi:hypothetical protein
VFYSLAPGVLETDEAMAHLNLGCCRLELPVADRDKPQE